MRSRPGFALFIQEVGPASTDEERRRQGEADDGAGKPRPRVELVAAGETVRREVATDPARR